MAQARQENLFGYHRIISITDPDQIKPDLGHLNAKEILQLSFHDVLGAGDNSIAFNDDHFLKIIDFHKNIRDDDDVMVHCHAGISRSSAVGIILAIINKPKTPDQITKAFKDVLDLHPVMIPNQRVIAYCDHYLGLNNNLNQILTNFRQASDPFYLPLKFF